MKKDIHPKLIKGTLKCACGNKEEITAPRELIDVEICHKCHPLFVGNEEKRAIVGQVEKFQKKYQKKIQSAKGKS